MSDQVLNKRVELFSFFALNIYLKPFSEHYLVVVLVSGTNILSPLVGFIQL